MCVFLTYLKAGDWVVVEGEEEEEGEENVEAGAHLHSVPIVCLSPLTFHHSGS